jgi:hypothetical protein
MTSAGSSQRSNANRDETTERPRLAWGFGARREGEEPRRDPA